MCSRTLIVKYKQSPCTPIMACVAEGTRHICKSSGLLVFNLLAVFIPSRIVTIEFRRGAAHLALAVSTST